MPESYEVLLVDIGSKKNHILEYLKSSSNIGHEEAQALLAKLPVTLRRTNNRFEARIIKEALEALGAQVEIKKYGSASSSSSSSRSINSNYTKSIATRTDARDTRGDYSSSDYDSPISSGNNSDSSVSYSNYQFDTQSANPIKESTGCALIIVAGFLVFLSMSICFGCLIL